MKKTDIYKLFEANMNTRCAYRPGDKVLAAVSGGADSVCMLFLLNTFLPHGTLGVAHFNHSIRGEEADRDEAFTKETAEKLGLPFYAGRGDIISLAASEGTGLEECARKYRYLFLKETAEQYGYSLISVAHNMDDNAETILMHIFRGCTVDGICGLEYRSGNIIRPMLDIDRDNILSYLRSAGQSYITDSTNSDDNYLRNRMRNKLIPYISENLGYDVRKVLVRQTGLCSSDREFIESAALDYLDNNVTFSANGQVKFDPVSFSNLHEAVGRRVLRHAVAGVKDARGKSPYGGRKDIESGAIERALEALKSGKKGKVTEIGRGVRLRITHSGACLYCSEESSEPAYRIEIKELTAAETEKRRSGKGFASEKDTVFFDKAKYIDIIKQHGQEMPVFRRYESGDTITPFGMQGTKKVQKLFIDLKVPKEQRSELRLLAAGNEVLWIPGICLNEKLRITDGTEKILKITVQGE